jgi:uncharacterized protein YuzE
MGIEIMDASKVMNVEYLKDKAQPPKTKVQNYLEHKKQKGQ